MIEFILNEGKKNVILFVHGFTGGKETWAHEKHGYFYQQLLQHDVIQNNYDVAIFEYFSALTDMLPAVTAGFGKIMSLFSSVSHKAKKNIAISQIAELLYSQIRFSLASYGNIVIIAHSMGGLVAKACVLKDIELGSYSRVKMILSLAVPHQGANLATFGKLFTSHKQIADLAPLSELCISLSNSWVKTGQKPDIKYFYGTYDGVVEKNSAIGLDNNEQDAIACDEDHTSISKPSGINSIVVRASVKFLEEFLIEKTGLVEYQKLTDDGQFKDEVFVLKLLLADVHNASVKNCKRHFLNAEYVRKLFSSSADQEKLQALYNKIRTIYHNCYDQHVAKSGVNSTTLVNSVHQKIVDEDAGYLKVTIPMLEGLHKMGMLHQLANDLSDDIWWSETQCVEALNHLQINSESQGD